VGVFKTLTFVLNHPLNRELRLRDVRRLAATENVLFLKDAESVKTRFREARMYRTNTVSTI